MFYFVAASLFHHVDDLHGVEGLLGVLFLLEFAARLFISNQRWRDLFSPVGLAGMIVIASLPAPSLAENFSFLRVVRAQPRV